jgi:hypothetical protein
MVGVFARLEEWVSGTVNMGLSPRAEGLLVLSLLLMIVDGMVRVDVG